MADFTIPENPEEMAEFVENKAFLEHIFNSIREGIIVIDKDLKIRYRNGAATRMLGIPEETSRLALSSFLKGVDWKNLIIESGRSRRSEIEILYPERRILRFYVIPHGEDPLATVILDDITEEFDRHAAHTETEKSKMISMLAAGVAHEIGNPLNSLYLNLQLLERMISRPGFDLADASESIAEAKKEVERLDGIINEFLKALRPAKMNFQLTEISDVIHETVTFMRRELEDRKIKIECELSATTPRIQADASQLHQVFYNLFRNAAQSMPRGGVLRIVCFEEGDTVRVEISDTGKGISPDDMTKIFQAFYTTRAKGNGLGLMIVERIIRAHGAKISIESKEQTGTTFTLLFPISQSRVRVLPSASAIAGMLPGSGKVEKKELSE